MSEETIISAKYRILDLLSDLTDSELETIEQWICSHSYRKGVYCLFNTKVV